MSTSITPSHTLLASEGHDPLDFSSLGLSAGIRLDDLSAFVVHYQIAGEDEWTFHVPDTEEDEIVAYRITMLLLSGDRVHNCYVDKEMFLNQIEKLVRVVQSPRTPDYLANRTEEHLEQVRKALEASNLLDPEQVAQSDLATVPEPSVLDWALAGFAVAVLAVCAGNMTATIASSAGAPTWLTALLVVLSSGALFALYWRANIHSAFAFAIARHTFGGSSR